MFVVITDGGENASCEYTSEKVKTQVERQKAKHGWEFIFFGANIDAIETSRRLGISDDRAVDYLADSEGTALNFKVMSAAVEQFRKNATISNKHFEEIRKDVKKRSSRK